MTPQTPKKLYLIGNAHIDPVWLWQWQDGYHEARATFRSALDRLNEYPDFVFSASSAAIYAWVEQADPALFDEIRQRVAEGRWKIVGGWWIEPDCNIPCGESFARQGLIGQGYFKEKFGVTATVGYNIDSFGHNAMLPQILAKSGLTGYVFLRPSPHEKGLPSRLFWWESDDGSRVLAFRIALEYCTWGKELTRHIANVAAELNDSLDEMMCFYGVGNHGGGPTRENLDSIRALREDPNLPELVFAGPDDYFAAVLAKDQAHPVVHDDLQHHASGCYAAHSGIKKWNRTAENRLLAAEKFSVLAERVTGQPYAADLTRAWKNVLFNQFHDILAGTSLEEAYEDARNQIGEALAIADRALTQAVQAIAWQIDIQPEPGLTPLVVFNPHAWTVRANVEVEMGRPREAQVLVDDRDQPVPFQFVQSHATAGRARLSFAADLPPTGYRVYRLVSRPAGQPFADVAAAQSSLENERFRLEIDPHTGYIHSLRDKTMDLEVFAGDAAVPVVIDDPSDTWSHNVFAFQRVEGQFSARKVELVEQGPVKAVLRVTSAYNHSTLVQDFAMFAGRDEIEVGVTVDWREQRKMLKLRFPVRVHQVRAACEIPYGHIERAANGEEEPCQGWIDLSGVSRDTGARYGLSLLNDAKYSYDVTLNDIGLTVLRSPIYAHHDPAVPDPARRYAYIDQGVQTFHYTLLPHAGSWIEAGTVRKAAELNQPPAALVTTLHSGPLAHSQSFLDVDAENLVVSALKQAEDGSGDLILRAYETAGSAVTAALRLPRLGRTITAAFGPCEVKTFRIPRDETRLVVETNLLEA
jgi:alpha-mannosidase